MEVSLLKQVYKKIKKEGFISIDKLTEEMLHTHTITKDISYAVSELVSMRKVVTFSVDNQVFVRQNKTMH